MKKLIAILLLALSGCTAVGLYQMSDDWCTAHPQASQARCIR